jgi:hypothetical protein
VLNAVEQEGFSSCRVFSSGLGKKNTPLTQLPAVLSDIASSAISYDASRAFPGSLLQGFLPPFHPYGISSDSSTSILYGGGALRPHRLIDSSLHSADILFGATLRTDLALWTIIGLQRPLVEADLRGGAAF